MSSEYTKFVLLYKTLLLIFFREIWVESLSQAIKSCTEEHANSILPVGNSSKHCFILPYHRWCHATIAWSWRSLSWYLFTISARGRHLSGPSSPWLSLGVLQANNLALSTSNCKTRNHYCSIHLEDYKCRTPSVKAKCWPSWNFQVRLLVLIIVSKLLT